MLHQFDPKAYEQAVQSAQGESREAFLEKQAWLVQRWEGAKDSIAARLICPIVLRRTLPINISIIADNLSYFEQYYHERYNNPDKLQQALDVACLCGSEKIANFLIKKINTAFLNEDYQDLLGYVSASNNKEWTNRLAKTFVDHNKKMPMNVYTLAYDPARLHEIREIFELTPESKKRKISNK